MKALIKYINKRKNIINDILRKKEEKYTPGTFHNIRVEIKKVNAILKLINTCSADFKRKRTFKPFKLIFIQAGVVRELQMEEAVLKKHLKNDKLINFRFNLKQELLEQKKKYFEIPNRKLLKNINRKYKEIELSLSGVNKKGAVEYLNEKGNSCHENKYFQITSGSNS